ncbi:MAG TPA: ATP synthase F1 subunit delta [Polyangiaceae bacterium]|nr:ATP synthase F1 subunit delta [Polyangiaceae bacterium]
MMVPAAVAQRYAKALFALGEESRQLDGLVAELTRAATAYDASPDLRAVLENPLVPHAAKRDILKEIATKLSLGASARNTLLLLSDRRRFRALPAIVRELRTLSDKKRGVVRAQVTCAKPLTPAYLERLRVQLERMTGNKVELDVATDPELLAGVVARIGDRVYDGSLRSRLREIRAQLLPN